jgi:malonyl-CoA O-methyltransferase
MLNMRLTLGRGAAADVTTPALPHFQVLPMLHKSLVSRRFSGSVRTYDSNSSLQNAVAERLCGVLPANGPEVILEVGCGTGVLTRHMIRRYPDCRFIITDISPEMVFHCREKYRNMPNLAFAVMDGDRLATEHRFDMIASSMCLQWFDDPLKSIRRQLQNTKPGGSVAFAAIGGNNFPEWQETMNKLGEPAGLIQMPELPGVVREEHIQVDYGCAGNFLASLRATGAQRFRPGYRPMSPSILRRACAAFNRLYAGRITWHIVYGLLHR